MRAGLLEERQAAIERLVERWRAQAEVLTAERDAPGLRRLLAEIEEDGLEALIGVRAALTADLVQTLGLPYRFVAQTINEIWAVLSEAYPIEA